YSLSDVVRMTTIAPAKALGMGDKLGGLAVGREADITIFDVVPGRWRFTDTVNHVWSGDKAIVPVRSRRAGEVSAPGWGPHPGGWPPDTASREPGLRPSPPTPVAPAGVGSMGAHQIRQVGEVPPPHR